MNKAAKIHILALALILLLAGYNAFIPHQDYAYPLHVDEWKQLVHAEALVKMDSISFVDPLPEQYDEGTYSPTRLEIGFHLFLGILQQISGLSWPAIFRYFPGLIFMITVLAVYILARREGFGLEAAFFTALIPTSVGILGPAFLVPVSLGLLFTPLILFLAFNFRSFASYLLIFIFASFLFSMHAPSLICPVLILIPYLMLNLIRNFRHSLFLTLSLAAPALLFPWYYIRISFTAQSILRLRSLLEYVHVPSIMGSYGYLTAALFLLGIFVLARRGGRKYYGLTLGILVLLLMLVTFHVLHYGIPIFYYRGLLYLMLMIGLVAGAGLAAIRGLRLPDRLISKAGDSHVARYAAQLGCVAIVAVTLCLGIPNRQATYYYHMINDDDYQTFAWIRDNVGAEYEKAVLDPIKATAFVAVTGKQVFTRVHSYPKTSDTQAEAFLADGCTDTAFMTDNNISIVYNPAPCDNPELVRVAEDIYLLNH